MILERDQCGTICHWTDIMADQLSSITQLKIDIEEMYRRVYYIFKFLNQCKLKSVWCKIKYWCVDCSILLIIYEL